ncbi:uncharacterized protein LOC122663088 [Telopea speciosissima]|uniref:uncharacterized protein LOC122663088 n=1 Tax=Telopea speciosissima TaxID=54955 RepID=UPI001CC8111A|nr:uncharacterized protein LOC122663088 [Telopea speciosissima]
MEESTVTWAIVDFFLLIINFVLIEEVLMVMRNIECNQRHFLVLMCWNSYGVLSFPPFGKDNIDKDGGKRKRGLQKPELPFNWKKKSIFFDLPYWKNNVVRHNLDVMHIEKNVCDSIIGTLLGMKDKTKDHVNARLDLKDMKIRVDLHPKIIEGRDKVILPPAYYTLSNEDKEVFCTILSGVKVPDGYASNISRNVQVKERIISGMKSHDCHIMMQQLLPVSFRSVLPKNVGKVLIEICEFFRDLCSKVGSEEDFKRLNQSIAVSMCNLERYFPPGFFDVMVHLIVHLASEASLAGPVHYRWMYPIERFLKQLKDYVRNNSRPEGSIAEGYIAEECIIICSRYFEGVETRLNRPSRNDVSLDVEDPHSIFSSIGRPLGKCELLHLEMRERNQAHRCVLVHYKGINEYQQLHLKEIKRQLGRNSRPKKVMDLHDKDFPKWFNEHILKLRQNGIEVLEHIKCLARGPNSKARSYMGYIINGIRFHSKVHEINRKTQNSGVLITALTNSFSSQKDKHPIEGHVTYYGILKQVIELEYSVDLKWSKCE